MSIYGVLRISLQYLCVDLQRYVSIYIECRFTVSDVNLRELCVDLRRSNVDLRWLGIGLHYLCVDLRSDMSIYDSQLRFTVSLLKLLYIYERNLPI